MARVEGDLLVPYHGNQAAEGYKQRVLVPAGKVSGDQRAVHPVLDTDTPDSGEACRQYMREKQNRIRIGGSESVYRGHDV